MILSEHAVFIGSYTFSGTTNYEWPDGWKFHSKSVCGALMKAIAKAWQVPLSQMLKKSLQSTDEKKIVREIGISNGEPVLEDVYVLKKPK